MDLNGFQYLHTVYGLFLSQLVTRSVLSHQLKYETLHEQWIELINKTIDSKAR